MAFNSTEKTNIAYKLFYQIAGTANAAPGAQYWYNESLAWSPIIPLNKLWDNFYNIQPASTKSQADANVLVNTDLQKVTVRLTVISTSNNRAYLAISGSTLENWIQPTLIRTATNEPSVGYGVSLWNGDPNLGGTELDTTYHADSYGEPSWSFNYSAGLVLISTDEASTYKTFNDGAGLYLQGYRYVGATGLTSSAITSLSQLTDVTIVNVQSGQTLMYSAGTWMNTDALVDLSSYYSSAQTNILLSDLYNSLSGKPYLYELQDVSSTIVSAVDGDALIWNSGLSKWVATGITVDMMQYYTKTEINTNFYNSAQTLEYFSLTGHSHYVTGLTDVVAVNPATGDVLMYSAGTWVAAATALSGSYVSLSGDTMFGNLSFSFMTGTTNRLLYVNTGGTVNSGEDIVSLYLSGSSLLNYIQDEINWTGSTFIGNNLSAYTLYEGQKYIDTNYFYEYLDGTLYRTFYANKDHNHNSLYYTQTQLLVDGVLDSRYITASAQTFLIDLGDTNIVVSALTSNSYLKFNSISSKWEKYDINISSYAKTADVVPNTRQLTTSYPLLGGGYLSGNLSFSHASMTATTSLVAPSGSVIVGMVFDGYGHITSYTTSNINSLIKSNLFDLNDVSITSLQNKQSLVYDTGSSRWKNTTLNKSYISDFVESAYTHTYGDEFITGLKTFSGNTTFVKDVYIGGNLYVAGSATTIYTRDLSVFNKWITLNSGQTGGYGVVGGQSGIIINRGWYPSFYIMYDEGDSVNTSGGTLRIGISGDTQAVATRENNPINGGIAYWNENDYRFDTSSNFIFSGNTVYLNGTLIANFVITATTINANAVNTKALSLSSGITVFYIQDSTGVTNSAQTLLSEQAIVEYVKSSIDVENLWDRSGATLITHNIGDDVYLGGNLSANTFYGNLDWSYIINKPTTLSGYGITDAYTKNEINVISANTLIYVNENYLSISGGTIYGNLSINGNFNLLSGITVYSIQNITGITDSAQTLLTEQAVIEYVATHSGTAIPAGNTYDVQFNSGGTLAASNNFIYNSVLNSAVIGTGLTTLSANTVYVPNLNVCQEIELTKNGGGIIVVSDNGFRYKITVDDIGNLTTTSL